MVYSLADLTGEIEGAIDRMDSGSVRALSPDLVTEAVIGSWGEISGECADRFVCTANAWVRNQVRLRINRYKAQAAPEADAQLVMDGFERLQKRYLIEEDGEHVAVRVQDLTPTQRLAKAAELRAMGDGCYQHAQELERYNESVTREPLYRTAGLFTETQQGAHV